YVEDLADALVHLMRRFEPTRERTFLNVGVGEDVSIAELAALVKRIVGYEGDVAWNTAMPDGTPRKLLDVSGIAAIGWRAATPLEEGLRKTYAWFLENRDRVRR
ncbi:MAG: GDP-L-fucose synthase, partial [Proteobacteria bacterium]|nr:GDP-L-fucose synthase [Pseudomonadota bacterium]